MHAVSQKDYAHVQLSLKDTIIFMQLRCLEVAF